MGIAVKDKKRKRFRTTVDVEGDNADLIRDGLDAKMKKDMRKTYSNAIAAILVEYFSKK